MAKGKTRFEIANERARKPSTSKPKGKGVPAKKGVATPARRRQPVKAGKAVGRPARRVGKPQPSKDGRALQGSGKPIRTKKPATRRPANSRSEIANRRARQATRRGAAISKEQLAAVRPATQEIPLARRVGALPPSRDRAQAQSRLGGESAPAMEERLRRAQGRRPTRTR